MALDRAAALGILPRKFFNDGSLSSISGWSDFPFVFIVILAEPLRAGGSVLLRTLHKLKGISGYSVPRCHQPLLMVQAERRVLMRDGVAVSAAGMFWELGAVI